MLDFLKFGLPLFFASSATLTGGDGGGGDEVPTDTAGGGEGDGSATEATEAADSEASGSEVLGDDAEGREEAEETETEGPEGLERAVPGHIKKALSALKKIDPQAAEVARRAYYEAGDYKQVYPTVRQAREARELIESVGGPEGIQGLQTEATDYAKELTAMANGDPAIVDELAKDYPRALPALVSRGFEHLQKINPQGYERMLAPHLAATLARSGVASSIHRLMELIGDGKQTDAYDKAKRLANWISEVEEFAKAPAPREQQDETEKALAERQQQLDQREQNIFVGQASRSVRNIGKSAIEKAVGPMLKGRTLSAQQREDLMASIHDHLFKGFEGNQPYQQRMKAMVSEKDLKGIERYVRGQLTPDRVRRSVNAIWGLRGFAAKPAKTANGGGAPAGKAARAVATVGAKPDSSQIDWSKDPGKLRFMRGEATLKGGKVVRWKWD